MDTAPIILVRGAPGAGKSTFAQKLRDCIFQKHNRITAIFETDNFFVDSINHHDYHFDSDFLGIAHWWNQGEVIRCCRDCPEVPVIVANTFSQNWELKPYLEIAKAFKRPVYVFTLRTEHDNVHNVPEKTVQKHRLGMQDFTMDKFVRDGFPVVYHLKIMTDEEAAKIAQMVHFNFIEQT